MKRYFHLWFLFFLIIPFFVSAQEEPNFYLKGIANFQKKDFNEAIIQFSKVIEFNKNNTEYYYKRGECYYNIQHYFKAIDDFQKADSLKPGYGSFFLAKNYALIGNEKKSIEYLTIHLKSKYRIPQSHIMFDEAFSDLQYAKEWEKLWKNNWYTKYEDQLDEAEYLLKSKNYDEALEFLDNTISGKSRDHELLSLRARVFIALNDYRNALTDYDEAILLSKRNHEYYAERARILYKIKKYKKSSGDYSRAIELNPYDLKLNYERAVVNYELKNYEDAIKDITYYLGYFEKDEDAIFLCGKIHYENEDYLKALEYFNKNLELNTGNTEYFTARANTYLKTGTFQYAINDYSMALDLDPKDEQVYFNRGIARLSTGNLKEACFDWEQAKKYGHLNIDEYLKKYCSKE